MLKKNEGTLDRALRVALGAALLIAWVALPEAGYRPLLLIGIVPLVTGLLGWCPLYTLLGFSTCPAKRD